TNSSTQASNSSSTTRVLPSAWLRRYSKNRFSYNTHVLSDSTATFLALLGLPPPPPRSADSFRLATVGVDEDNEVSEDDNDDEANFAGGASSCVARLSFSPLSFPSSSFFLPPAAGGD